MDRKIVIIGAGASGVAAATKLIENGFTSVLLLEAENRIGGRINTVPFGDSVIDLGAQWCHGEQDNVVFELAKDKNLFESDMDRFSRMPAIQSDGNVISQNLNWQMLQAYMSILANNDLPSQSGSIGDYFTECFSKMFESPEYSEIDGELREAYLQHFQAREMGLNATDSWFNLSRVKYHEWQVCIGDFSLNWKDQGYATLFDLLTNKFENNRNHIRLEDYAHLKKEVIKVTYNVKESVEAELYPILIECSDGSSYNADHVICSVSLGVLKRRHKSIFQPPLPQTKIDTIEGMGFGVVGKIILEFEQPFWPVDWPGFTLLWKVDDLKGIRKQNGNEWLEYITGIFTINRQRNLLLVWINGAGAREMEQLPESQVRDGVTSVLKKFLKDWSIPDPIRMKRSNWFSNPHFLGSYSHYSIRGDSLNATIVNLAEPINDKENRPVVQFCGEATSEHHFKSVHGAVESGWREAERLIGIFK